MASKDSKVKTVTLVAPGGGDYEASSPVEVNNLVYGQGYSLKAKNKSLDEAIADLIVTDNVSAPSSTVTTTA